MNTDKLVELTAILPMLRHHRVVELLADNLMNPGRNHNHDDRVASVLALLQSSSVTEAVLASAEEHLLLVRSLCARIVKMVRLQNRTYSWIY